MTDVLVEDRGPVRWITLNRPTARNAQNESLLLALRDAVEATRGEPGVRVVVLAGAGPSFSAGHDLKEIVRNPSYRRNFDAVETLLRQERDLFVGPVEALRSLTVPTVARVQGHCLAASLMLIGAVDLVVAADNATFGSRVTRDMGAADVELPALAWALGERRAKQIMWLGETLDADEALRLGLVNWVVPEADLDAKVEEVTSSLADVAPEGLALSKMSLRFMEERRGRSDAAGYHFLAHQLSHHTTDAKRLRTQRIDEMERRLAAEDDGAPAA